MLHKMQCDYCGKEFYRNNGTAERKRTNASYCNLQCRADAYNRRLIVQCKWCGKDVTKIRAEYTASKTKNLFCNKSCACSYNNTQRRKSRRSKSEKQLFDLLVKEFPAITFIPNDKTMLDGYEVDVGIPELNLAIEWNGVVHFLPIYGQEKLSKIQERDAAKIALAQQKAITLIVVPDLVSTKQRVLEAFTSVSKHIRSLL
jgi:hypothetical protein